MVSFIDSSGDAQKQLQSLLAEVDNPEKRAMLEKAWNEDTSALQERAQFLKDQQQCSKLCLLNFC